MLRRYISLSATGRHPQGIMNTAYDNPERPPSPSYVGNYSSVHEPGLPPSYIYREDPPRRPHLPSSSSTVGILPPKKKEKRGTQCSGKSCLVFALLMIFIAISITMIALYFARDSQDGKESNNGKDGGTSQGTVKIDKTRFSLYTLL